MTEPAQDIAHHTIEERPLNLSQRDNEAFAHASLTPRPVNQRLRETVGRYRQAQGV